MMGADVVGWRDCPLQKQLEPEGFLGKLKLRSYRTAIEAQVPEEKREKLKVTVQVTGREPRGLTYLGIVSELEQFEAGIPECDSCPLAGGRRLGCYRYITYPVDETFERMMFDFFTSRVAERDSIADQIYRDFTELLEAGEGWYEPRGAELGSLAELEVPLEHGWVDQDGREHAMDSAQLMLLCFINLEQPALIVAYARWFSEFLAYVDDVVETLEMDGDRAQINVDCTDLDDLDPDTVARRSLEPIRAVTSRTIKEVRDVADLLRHTAIGSIEQGWTVICDS